MTKQDTKVEESAAFVPKGTEELVNDLLFSITNMFDKISAALEAKVPAQGMSVFDAPKSKEQIELEKTNEQRLNAHRAAKEAAKKARMKDGG